MALGMGRIAVGLEIDKGTARVVELTGSPQSPKLTGMAGIALPEGAVEEGMIVEPREVGEALKRLWSSGAVKERNVLLGVSNQGVLVRHAIVPKVSADKIDNMIRFHAQDHLPIPLNTVVLDYIIIGETVEEEKENLEVLLVAARRDMLDGFLKALDYARLEPLDIDVSTLALIWVLPEAARDRSVAVVNVANGLSSILVSVNSRPRMARLVSAKLKDLADKFGYSLNEVLSINHYDSGEYAKAIDAWVDNLAGEIRSSINYYQNQDNAAEIEAIAVNGRGALLNRVSVRLENRLELPVRITNPLAGITASPKIAGTGLESVEYAYSIGLARRGLEG